jgi:hypothetical protein
VIRYAFVTITDHEFFPGTMATVSSILEHHPEAEVFVVINEKRPLTIPQASCLARDARVRLVDSSRFAIEGRYIEAWELKAYAAHDLAEGYDVVVGIDSDCILCSNVQEEIRTCFETGAFLGGQDGDGKTYDDSYAPYGIATPAQNARYMSTSLYFCAVTDSNRCILKRWAECCNFAVFNGRGPYPGHGDQGVLNAVLFAENAGENVQLLENHLWSQHWTYWSTVIDYRDGHFINRSAEDRRQRAFHSSGPDQKFWQKEHVDRVLSTHPFQTYPYAWFLAMLWFGPCRNWSSDPFQYLPARSHHLTCDLVSFLPNILQVYPRARALWDELTEPLTVRLGRRPCFRGASSVGV